MIDLKPFCGTEEFRPYLHNPFTQEGMTYATDGRIAVRVSVIDGAPTDVTKPNVPKTFAENFIQPTEPLPAFDMPEEEFEECPNCKGQKTGYHGCMSCTCECDECDQDGEVSSDRHSSFAFGKFLIAAKYLRILKSLPGLLMAFPSDPLAKPASFSFDGGDGLIMGLRTASETHTVVNMPLKAAE